MGMMAVASGADRGEEYKGNTPFVTDHNPFVTAQLSITALAGPDDLFLLNVSECPNPHLKLVDLHPQLPILGLTLHEGPFDMTAQFLALKSSL
jgi:hypothetical protein